MKTKHPETSIEINVGQRLRQLRAESELSIRALAEKSQLNANTLSLIENGKTSPSVSTLRQIALALDVPIKAFFEVDGPQQQIVFQKAGQRPCADFSYGTMEDLGAGLARGGVEPFVVSLKPNSGSGDQLIVHTGLEFVYCIKGQIEYEIEGQIFLLDPGDSLLFEAHLPHRWKNATDRPSNSLLILCPHDGHDSPTSRHFAEE